MEEPNVARSLTPVKLNIVLDDIDLHVYYLFYFLFFVLFIASIILLVLVFINIYENLAWADDLLFTAEFIKHMVLKQFFCSWSEIWVELEHLFEDINKVLIHLRKDVPQFTIVGIGFALHLLNVANMIGAVNEA